MAELADAQDSGSCVRKDVRVQVPPRALLVVGSATYDQSVVHSPAPADTDVEVFRRQVDRWREMTPAQRAELADHLSVDVVKMASAGIRRDRPDISADELARELARRRYGRAFADAAWNSTDPT